MKIVWTETAIRTYEENIEYLFEDWTYKEVQHFIDATEKAIEDIKLFPQIGSIAEENSDFRKYLVVPQIYLYYKVVNRKEIYLAVFFNNYKNPFRLSSILIS